MNRLLVVDDDPLIPLMVAGSFPPPGYAVQTAASGAEGFAHFDAQRPDVVLLDVQLPDTSGLTLFRRLRDRDATVPVIFITATGTIDQAIEATKLGGYDYLFKPLDLRQVGDLVGKALQVRRLMSVPVAVGDAADAGEADPMVGRGPAMQAVYKAIGRAAPHDVTVLVRGESGTGKELVARAVYQHSRRADKPFLAINCAAIPDALLESELFGHEKGAFTGAERQRVGKFEQCHGGTLFLDEIGDMPLALQAKILRVLQERQFQRVGGHQTVQADVRLIAATLRDLEADVAAGRFREDLFYRLNVFPIALPPLRERREDIPLLVEHFLRRFGRELGREVRRVDPAASELINRYPWPGNVRQLENAVQSALLRATGPVLMAEDLPLPAAKCGPPPAGDEGWERFLDEELQSGVPGVYARALERMERLVLGRVLRQTGGHQTRAAEILGITRGSLRHKLRALGMQAGDPDARDED